MQQTRLLINQRLNLEEVASDALQGLGNFLWRHEALLDHVLFVLKLLLGALYIFDHILNAQLVAVCFEAIDADSHQLDIERIKFLEKSLLDVHHAPLGRVLLAVEDLHGVAVANLVL